MPTNNHINDAAAAELLLSAELEHEASGASIEYRGGRWIVHGMVQVDSFQMAAELLTEEAA